MALTIFLSTGMIALMILSYAYGRSIAGESVKRLTEANRRLRMCDRHLTERLERERYNNSILRVKVKELEELCEMCADRSDIKKSIRKVIM